jgi:hypothetical protein
MAVPWRRQPLSQRKSVLGRNSVPGQGLPFPSYSPAAPRRKKSSARPPVADRRSRVSPQDRCAKDCVSPGGIPIGTPGAVSTENCRPQPRQDLACRPGTDAQRIAHRCRWPAVWPARRGLHGNSASVTARFPPTRLLHPGGREAVAIIFLLRACCMQEGGVFSSQKRMSPVCGCRTRDILKG